MRRIIAGLLCASLAFYPEFTLAQIKPGGGMPVTPAGQSATSAGAIQGVTGGVPVPVTGTFTASLGGFTPSASGARMTPLTVTTSDSSGALPTGAVVVVSNVGATNPMYCNVNGVAATTSDQLIGANSWFAFTIPATITTLHCIATGGSTTANGVGGAGLPTGAGGGGGGGSSGGAVTTTFAAPTTSTGDITVVDSGTTCTGTLTPPQTQCTGTPTAGSFVQVSSGSAGAIVVTAATTVGSLSAVQFQIEISNDNATWYGRGLFLDSNPTPIWRNGVANASFTGSTPGGYPFWRIRATTFTGTSTPTVHVTVTLTQPTQMMYVGNLPTASNGSSSVASVNIQGATGGTPVPISGTVTASFSQFSPTPGYATLTVGATSSRVALPSGATVAVYNTGANAAFVQLGSTSVVATTTNDQVAPGGFLCFAVGSTVDLAAIETAGATTLNLSGGAGGCAGSGGGGGSNSSGNVFQANVFGTPRTNSGTGATTQVIAASGSLTIYLVNYAFQGQSATGTFEIGSGTGTNCATTYFPLTPTYDLSINSQGGEGPIGVLQASAPGAELCVKTTGSNTTTWRIGAAQQ